MEKKTMFALATLAAAMTASAATFEFIPKSSADSYDWNTPSLWYVSNTAQNSLPTKADNVWITATKIRNSADGLFINSGTEAEVNRLYLANNNDNPLP